jgi:hypothetical protein
MSVWRRRAIESFPELRRELSNRQEITNPYSLWFELLALWSDAHRSNDEEMVKRIYGYAEWCSRQRAEDLWNSVGVCFYEHVLDEGRCETVLPRLSDETILGRLGLMGVPSERDGYGFAPEGSARAGAVRPTPWHRPGRACGISPEHACRSAALE